MWKARTLSQARRTVLIQSVASAIPSYYMSVFCLPKRVCGHIDMKIKNFWWGFTDEHRHFHPKAWREFVNQNLQVASRFKADGRPEPRVSGQTRVGDDD